MKRFRFPVLAYVEVDAVDYQTALDHFFEGGGTHDQGREIMKLCSPQVFEEGWGWRVVPEEGEETI